MLEEHKRTLEISDLWIDVGMTANEVKECISVGDAITFKPNFSYIGNNKIKSKGIDNKVGVYIIAKTMRLLSKENLNIGIYAVASSQEEIGGKGSIVQTLVIKPDIAFSIDAGFATDIPNISEKAISEMILGKGVGICHNADNNVKLVELLKSIAMENNIMFQNNVPILASGGNNASHIQSSFYGIATAMISVPNRYMHTPIEICDLADVNAAIELLVKTIIFIDKNPNTSLLPYKYKK